MKVTLFGQRVFEDAVKSRILNEVIWTRLHPTCSDRHRKRGMGWRSGRTLSSPPLMSAPQSQLPAEPLLRKKDCNLPKRYLYPKTNKWYKENETVGGVHSWFNQIPYLLGGWPTNWKIIISQRFSHRIENFETHSRIPSLRVWHLAEEPLEYLALK